MLEASDIATAAGCAAMPLEISAKAVSTSATTSAIVTRPSTSDRDRTSVVDRELSVRTFASMGASRWGRMMVMILLAEGIALPSVFGH